MVIIMIFNDKQAAFIKQELGIDVPVGKPCGLDNQSLCRIQDEIFEIEVYETCICDDSNLSERGSIAAEIVTMIGSL